MKFHFKISSEDIALINKLLKMRDITEKKLENLGINIRSREDTECPVYITSEEGWEGGNFGIILLQYEYLPMSDSFYVMKCDICDEAGIILNTLDNFKKLNSFNSFKVGDDTFIINEGE